MQNLQKNHAVLLAHWTSPDLRELYSWNAPLDRVLDTRILRTRLTRYVSKLDKMMILSSILSKLFFLPVVTMTQVDKNARIWLYCKDLESAASLKSSSLVKGSRPGFPKALKHWAVRLDYMSSKRPSQVNKSILYHANNEQGLLVARELMLGEDEDEEWRNAHGFTMEDHGLVTINEARAKTYCENFNQLKIKYVATKDNCQRFVDDFLANLLPDTAICLPTTVKEAKQWFESISSLGLSSLANCGSAHLLKEMIHSRIGQGVIKETIKQINLNGFGKISILSESPIKEYMAKEGKQLVLTAFGEMTENMLNAGRGAFSWWNLLQIPAELIVNKLMKDAGFTDLQAYGGK